MSRRISLLWHRLLRTGVILPVLFGLALGSAGFSVTPPIADDSAYPCEGNGCGCRSAADCWLGCCCHTPAQRLAWAERNGVEPPAAVVRLAQRSQDDAPRKNAACCTGHDAAACCRPAAKPVRVCCAAGTAAKVVRKASRRQDDATPVVTPVRCRGLGHWWVASGEPLAQPGPPVTLNGPTMSEPVRLCFGRYSLDAAAPPTRPG